MASPFIYINGYPGVGKLTVAKELLKLVKTGKILDNHALIDPVAKVFERTMPEYQALRKSVRQNFLLAIAESTTWKDTTWIFTDQQSSSQVGSAAARDYQHAATTRGCPFISVILTCKIDENLARLNDKGRGEGNTKLVDTEILRAIRTNEDIYHFGGPAEIEIDVTEATAESTAQKIFEFVGLHTADSVGPNHTSNGAVSPPIRALTDIKGFKHLFIADIASLAAGAQVEMLCWVKSRPRRHKNIAFVDCIDTTGEIQAVINLRDIPDIDVVRLVPESSLRLTATVSPNNGQTELLVQQLTIISAATQRLTPAVRSTQVDILSPQNTDHLLRWRHIYVRNPLIKTLNEFRSMTSQVIRNWFEDHHFVDFSAPLITPSLLYEPNAAIHLKNLKTTSDLFLSQCAGFYLESGAHAHERVYNLGPSFRNESRTNRHLMEYWHIKAELCSGQLNDIIDLVELFLVDVARATEKGRDKVRNMLGVEPLPTFQPPFKRYTYAAAIELLQSNGLKIQPGDNINKPCEDFLTNAHHDQPVWITHKPRALEPFPYCIDPDDSTNSMTADLLAPHGFGEICGVAEKTFDANMLEERMREKGKDPNSGVYQWVREMRDFGLVPHTAFGMGFERLLRWLCGNRHVKDVIPFPRIFGRQPLP